MLIAVALVVRIVSVQRDSTLLVVPAPPAKSANTRIGQGIHRAIHARKTRLLCTKEARNASAILVSPGAMVGLVSSAKRTHIKLQ